ncbi:MAG TPA: hypothetical protein VKT75_16515 [Acidobacteriaceae bacterium]|nr:hypothetical protein [Acidobacteriaceae bacterium]
MARGNTRPDSGVDFLISVGPKTTPWFPGGLVADLEQLLGRRVDIASQGDSLEEARANLIQALTLFFETADASEIEQRFHSDLFVPQVEVPVG